MAKGATQDTTQRADKLSDTSTQQTQNSIFGAPPGQGAFGPGGLAGDYSKAQSNADQARSSAFTGASNIQQTGGFDPTQLSSLRTTLSGAGTDLGNFYKPLMQTGGYTSGDIARAVRAGTSGVANTYNTLSQRDQRLRAAQGGIGGDSTAQMARALGQQQATTTTDVMAKVHQAQLDNEMKAAQGLRDTTTGIGDIQARLESQVAGGVREGTTLMNQLYNTDSGRITDQGNMILKMMGIDTSNQSVALNALAQMAQRPGLLDNLLSIAKIAASSNKIPGFSSKPPGQVQGNPGDPAGADPTAGMGQIPQVPTPTATPPFVPDTGGGLGGVQTPPFLPPGAAPPDTGYPDTGTPDVTSTITFPGNGAPAPPIPPLPGDGGDGGGGDGGDGADMLDASYYGYNPYGAYGQAQYPGYGPNRYWTGSGYAYGYGG